MLVSMENGGSGTRIRGLLPRSPVGRACAQKCERREADGLSVTCTYGNAKAVRGDSVF